MPELDDIWSKMLADAVSDARSSGRHDVADYLALKATNDQIRQKSVAWLFDTVIGLAAEANRTNSSITIEREQPHNFAFRGSNMVGGLVRVRSGVRSVTVEAGWTRTPADGIMRGGALAHARIVHFGMPEHRTELVLARMADLPEWVDPARGGAVFRGADMQRHLDIFLGDV